jgi:hypothetical protein
VSRHPRPRRPKRVDEPRWSVDDALRIKADLVDWFRGRDGVKAAYLAYTWYYGSWPGELGDPWSFAERTASDTAASLVETPLIWCDPPMTDLIAAAADTYPPEPFYPHGVPAPDGMVIFAKPLPIVWREALSGAETEQRLAAISWGTGESTHGRPVLSIVSWARGTGLFRYPAEQLAVRYPGLRLLSQAVGEYGATPEDEGGPAGPNRILQTLVALCRTPLVKDEHAHTSAASRQRATKAGVVDWPVRRIYLRRPDIADADRLFGITCRDGAPHRGHGARGHRRDRHPPATGNTRSLHRGHNAGIRPARNQRAAGLLHGRERRRASGRGRN